MNVGSGDVVDRLSIVKLKMERTEDKPHQEYEAYNVAFNEIKIKYPQFNWDLFLDIAYRANGVVWDLESGIRTAQLDNDIVETGKRAIIIRKVNGVRIGVRNLINSITGDGFVEIKHKDHISR
jgi:hypothetical protein